MDDVSVTSLSDFEAGRHERVDDGMRAKVASKARARSNQPSQPSRSSIRYVKSDKRVKGKTSRGTSDVTWNTGRRRAGTSGLPLPIRLRPAKDDTVRGLCNKCAPSNWVSLVPRFAKAFATCGVETGIRTILGSLGDADVNADVFVEVVDTLAKSSPVIASAIERCAASFWDKRPMMMDPSPEPDRDYDGFCEHVRERRRRKNLVSAFISMDVGPSIDDVVDRALSAIDACPKSVCKDVAISSIKSIVVRGCARDLRERVMLCVRARVSIPDSGDDSRTVFALRDVVDPKPVAAGKPRQRRGWGRR